MWGRFFDSIGHDDGDSAVSGSAHTPHTPDLRHMKSLSSMHHLSHLQQSPMSEVHPNDSASVVDDEPTSVLDSFTRQKGLDSPIPISARRRGALARDRCREARHGSFFIEFRPSDGSTDRPDPIDFILSYTDADGDTVLITSDHDVTDAVKIARAAGTDRVVLFVQGGKGWAEAGADKGEAKAAEAAAAAQIETQEVEKQESVLPESVTFTPPAHVHVPPPPPQEVLGIPKDLLLPASIGALAVVIIGVFAVSRMTGSRY
ncbi:CBS-domain-containing protein [Salix suchowensis]|nr:CBS-domain-containing protein [Salix suchowensis]